jgi:hypothetical protein
MKIRRNFFILPSGLLVITTFLLFFITPAGADSNAKKSDTISIAPYFIQATPAQSPLIRMALYSAGFFWSRSLNRTGAILYLQTAM